MNAPQALALVKEPKGMLGAMTRCGDVSAPGEVRHASWPPSAAIIILRSLKMFGMAQAVGELATGTSRHSARYRNLVERFFNKIKHDRGVATRYDKRADNSSPASNLPQSALVAV